MRTFFNSIIVMKTIMKSRSGYIMITTSHEQVTTHKINNEIIYMINILLWYQINCHPAKFWTWQVVINLQIVKFILLPNFLIFSETYPETRKNSTFSNIVSTNHRIVFWWEAKQNKIGWLHIHEGDESAMELQRNE